jgi:hypothetical protein
MKLLLVDRNLANVRRLASRLSYLVLTCGARLVRLIGVPENGTDASKVYNVTSGRPGAVSTILKV